MLLSFSFQSMFILYYLWNLRVFNSSNYYESTFLRENTENHRPADLPPGLVPAEILFITFPLSRWLSSLPGSVQNSCQSSFRKRSCMPFANKLRRINTGQEWVCVSIWGASAHSQSHWLDLPIHQRARSCSYRASELACISKRRKKKKERNWAPIYFKPLDSTFLTTSL